MHILAQNGLICTLLARQYYNILLLQQTTNGGKATYFQIQVLVARLKDPVILELDR